jgi:hypothetical protein
MAIPEDPEGYDPVFWNWDKRAKRDGGMLVCERRGSFPAYRKSVYHLKDEIRQRLGSRDTLVDEAAAVGEGDCQVHVESVVGAGA